MSQRTIYVVVADKKGKRLGVTALKRLASELTTRDKNWIDRYHGDYIAGGTRFDLLDPEHEHSAESPCVQTPVLKLRGQDAMRSVVLKDVTASGHRIMAVAGHDRKAIR